MRQLKPNQQLRPIKLLNRFLTQVRPAPCPSPAWRWGSGRYCGATVDFFDIDPATGLVSMAALMAKLVQGERDGTLTKVVVPVHLAGSSCAMAAIGALAKRYGFAVLEDASHAIGGRYQGGPVGNCCHRAITVFSFHPVKIITTGEGGPATTNDPLLAQRMAELCSHGIVREAERFGRPAAGPWV